VEKIFKPIWLNDLPGFNICLDSNWGRNYEEYCVGRTPSGRFFNLNPELWSENTDYNHKKVLVPKENLYQELAKWCLEFSEGISGLGFVEFFS
jgi:hypothetical protein